MSYLLICCLSILQDVEHAVLFSQSLCMSAFELRTALPCSQVVWQATSAEDWRVVQQRVSLTSLSPRLKAVAMHSRRLADTVADSCLPTTSAVGCTEDLLNTNGCS